MKIKIDEENCHLRLLKIPKNYRVIEDWELYRDLKTNKTLKQIATDGWIFVNTIHGIRLASFSHNYSGFHIYAINYANNSSACGRGVFVRKEIKMENEIDCFSCIKKDVCIRFIKNKVKDDLGCGKGVSV